MKTKFVFAWLGILAVIAGVAVWLGIGLSNFSDNRDKNSNYNFELYPAGKDRFDCYPDPNATEEACVNRGCVWGEPEIPDAPWCFYPSGHGYRMVSMKVTLHPSLAIHAIIANVSNYFPMYPEIHKIP